MCVQDASVNEYMNLMYMFDKTDRRDKLGMIRPHSTTRYSANLNKIGTLLEIEHKPSLEKGPFTRVKPFWRGRYF